MSGIKVEGNEIETCCFSCNTLFDFYKIMCVYHPMPHTKIVFQVDLGIKTKVLNTGRIC